MKLPGALKYLTFSMVLLGSLTLLWTLREIQFVTDDLVFLVLIVFTGSLFFWETSLHTRVYAAGWNLFTIVFVLYLFMNFQSRNLIVSAAYLSVFLQIFKCYNRKTNKDYVQMYLISFFQFISCTGITSSPVFFLGFGTYMFLALWALITFHMKRRLEKYSVAQYHDEGGSRYLVAGGLMDPEDIEEVNLYRNQTLKGVVTPGFLGGTFLLGIVILMFGVVLFYILPRPSEAGPPTFLRSIGQQLGQERVTGLSDEVDLSKSGRIFSDDTIVMKITPVSRSSGPETILWRAGAHEYYDGMKWRTRNPGRGRVYADRDDPGLMITDRYGYVNADPGTISEYRVHVENPAVDRIVSADSTPVAVGELDARLEERGNETYYVVFRGMLPSVYSYRVWTNRRRPSDEDLRRDEGRYRYHAYFAQRYLYLPQLPRVVDETLRAINTSQYVNQYDKAKAIERFLEEHCSYTMDVKRTRGVESPIEDFLVHTRSGHCELFAGTMAVLCRRAGIPARVAYGYKTSEWNEYGQFYQVRQKDAHAWVEVYFASVRKWVSFDPSPAQAGSQVNTGFFRGFFGSMTRFLEAMKSRWYDSVVFYNLEKQKKLAMRLINRLAAFALKLDSMLHRLRYAGFVVWSWLSESRFVASVAVLSISSVLIAGVLLIRQKANARRRFKDSYQQGISKQYHHRVRYYEKMLRILMGAGIIKPESATPMEFADDLETRDARFAGVKYVTDAYYTVRYGGAELQASELQRVEGILSNLRKTVFLKR
jgi:transglutaminase-like putative cysteine protease